MGLKAYLYFLATQMFAPAAFLISRLAAPKHVIMLCVGFATSLSLYGSVSSVDGLAVTGQVTEHGNIALIRLLLSGRLCGRPCMMPYHFLCKLVMRCQGKFKARKLQDRAV